MEIREVSKEEKREVIKKLKTQFDDIRSFMRALETDMESTDLKSQGNAVWISGALCDTYQDFRVYLRNLDQKKSTLDSIKTEIKEIVDDNSITQSANIVEFPSKD